MHKRSFLFVLAGLSIVVLFAGLIGPAGPRPAWANDKIDPEVLAHLDQEGQGTFLVYLTEQADLSRAHHMRDWNKRGWFVLNALREVAQRTQPAVLSALNGLRIAGHVSEFQPFYIVNLVVVHGDLAAARAIARLPGVAAIYPEMKLELVEPVETTSSGDSPQAVEWNIQKIRADQVWTTYGVTGVGVVVANIDSGVEWVHPALITQYRGNDGNHDYDWWDPLDLYDYPYPVHGAHGTHVMGTSVGDDGGTNQIGVAPGAKWIAAAGCCPDNEALLSSTEWAIAPWQVNDFDPSHPTADPAMRPHVVNNSWGGPGGSLIFNELLEAQRAAGIVPVFSAGNGGSACGTLGSPGDNPASFNTAATDANDNVAGFSARGPDPFHSWYGLFATGPEISAPGVNIRSSVPGGGYQGGWSGTSMAAPHTTGLVALLWSAEPDLIGRVAETEEIIRRTAVPRTSGQECGGVPGSQIPNNTYGWGRIDALTAVEMIWQAGTLAGTVTDASTGDPVPDARILAQRSGYTLTTGTDGAGIYGFLLGQGSYDVTVRAYGYQPWSATGVNISQDVTTTLDVALTPLATHTLSGIVEEGLLLAVGDPIWARVGVRDSSIDTTTNPVDGTYSTPVAEGDHWMRVTARGYLPEDRTIEVIGDLTEDFALTPSWTYYVRDSRSPCGPTFNWVDATDGTPHNVNDDAYFSISEPSLSPFPYYGNTYSSYYVGSNGFISFGMGYPRAHMVFPFEGAPNNAIYGLEEDLNPANGAQGIIYHKVLADRYLVVEFFQVEHWESGYPETFEFILDSQTGAILVQYLEVSWPDFTSVGVENQDGSDGIAYSFANSADITNSLAVGFYPVFAAPPADQDDPGVLGTLSGTVYITATTTPVPGALVTATTFLRELTTVADGSGHYVFPDICADLYLLQANDPAYYPSAVVPARLRWAGDVGVTDLYLGIALPAPALTKTVSSDPIPPGEYVTYTLSLANQGDADLLDALLSDELPAEVAYITSTPPGFYQAGVLTWTVDIPVGGASEVTIVGLLSSTAVPSNTVVNTAYLFWDSSVISSSASFHVHWPSCQEVQNPALSWTPSLPFVGEAVTFSGTVEAGDAPITFTWDFGDGSSDTGATVTHVYTQAGTYNVVLTAINCDGAGQAVVSDTLSVQPYMVYLPLVSKSGP